jgi:hypothetical protein
MEGSKGRSDGDRASRLRRLAEKAGIKFSEAADQSGTYHGEAGNVLIVFLLKQPFSNQLQIAGISSPGVGGTSGTAAR